MRRYPLIVVLLVLSAVGFLAYYFFVSPRSSNFAALAVNTPGQTQTVKLNGEVKGETPFYSDKLKPGEAILTLASFTTRLNLERGTLTVVNRALGPASVFDFGEMIFLEKEGETRLSVLSDPEGAKVNVDGKVLGETPLTTSDVSSGEHTLVVSSEGFRKSETRIRTQPGYKLTANVDLMLLPVPEEISKLDVSSFQLPASSFQLFDLTVGNPLLYSDPQNWAKGVMFLRKIQNSKFKIQNLNYLVDYEGRIYDAEGDNIEVTTVSKAAEGSEINVGYLGKTADGGVSEAAKKGLEELATQLFPEEKVKKVKIKPTGTGWLRARESPSFGGKEIAKADVGKEYKFLEEKDRWVKIELEEGISGWVYRDYVEILE